MASVSLETSWKTSKQGGGEIISSSRTCSGGRSSGEGCKIDNSQGSNFCNCLGVGPNSGALISSSREWSFSSSYKE